MTTLFQRNIQDATFEQSIALPDAEATVSTTPFDIGEFTTRASGANREQLDFVVLLLTIPACPALQDGKSITFEVQHSDAAASGFAATDPALSTTITGAGGTGSAAKEVRLCLPHDVKRYVAVSISAEADAGDSSAVSATVQLLF